MALGYLVRSDGKSQCRIQQLRGQAREPDLLGAVKVCLRAYHVDTQLHQLFALARELQRCNSLLTGLQKLCVQL